MAVSAQDEQRLALFIDFENIALGVRDAQYKKFDINLVLERLIEKGQASSSRRPTPTGPATPSTSARFHEAAIELIDIPQQSYGGKNSADIRMVVDAMDLCYSKEHITRFVICSGDSDFSPLVSKLKENDKYVIGLGVKNSTSDLLIDNCDEFIFYEDLVREHAAAQPASRSATCPRRSRTCFSLLLDSIQALQRENKDVLWGSMVKQTMKRKKPYFNETYYGYSSFSELLEDAQRRGHRHPAARPEVGQLHHRGPGRRRRRRRTGRPRRSLSSSASRRPRRTRTAPTGPARPGGGAGAAGGPGARGA